MRSGRAPPIRGEPPLPGCAGRNPRRSFYRSRGTVLRVGLCPDGRLPGASYRISTGVDPILSALNICSIYQNGALRGQCSAGSGICQLFGDVITHPPVVSSTADAGTGEKSVCIHHGTRESTDSGPTHGHRIGQGRHAHSPISGFPYRALVAEGGSGSVHHVPRETCVHRRFTVLSK